MNSLQIRRIYTLHRLLYTGRKVNSYQLRCCPLTKVYSYTEKFELSKLELMEKLF
ncbi:MAG: hypothetical protein ISR00_02615 [Flavobacteriales bacterium]|nr:hypothetical protein [Flavobacteriales bacterium]MBL6872824.1 hypothetical protein [Flavobacteriales bacterium]